MKRYCFIKDLNKKATSKSYQKIADKASDFIFLEAVRFTPNTWLDTGLKGNLNTETEFIIQLEEQNVAGSGRIFGSRQSNSNNTFTMGSYNGKIDIDQKNIFKFNGGSYECGNYTKYGWTRKRRFTLKKDFFSVFRYDNQSFSEYTFDMNDEPFETPTNLLLGGFCNDGAYPTSSIKGLVYSCKIWESGILKRDFRPAKRKSDNRVGFYEMVEGRFYLETPNSTARFTEA